MDPQTCWRDIVALITEWSGAAPDRDDRQELSWKLRDLADWIDNGGFFPQIEAPNCLEAVKILSALTDKLVEVQTKEIRNGNGTYRSSPS